MYPIIVEISKNKIPFKVDKSDSNFDKPLSELNRDYSQKGNVKLITKIR